MGIQEATFTILWVPTLALLLVATLCGMWNGLWVSRAKISPLVVTLVLMVAGRALALSIFPGMVVSIYYEPYFFFGNGYVLGLPFPLFVVAVVFGLIWLLTNKTALGLFMRAATNEPVHPAVSNVKNVKLLVYMICGFCAGLSGLIASSNVKYVDPNNIGIFVELDTIMAIVIGGTALGGGRFSLTGSLVGALAILNLTRTIYYAGILANAGLCMKAVVLLLIVILGSARVRVCVSNWMKDE